MKEKKNMRTLPELREELNALDKRVLADVALRQELAREVYWQKQSLAKDILDPQQEMNKIISLKEEVAPEHLAAAKAVQETMMRMSREEQYRLTLEQDLVWEPGETIDLATDKMPDYRVVAVQGNALSYAGEAAQALFPAASLMPSKTFESACQSVVEEMVDVCVLPLENSTAGTVDDVYALLEKHNLYIVATRAVEIHHCLVGLPGTSLGDLRTVLSHPQALAQCSTVIKGMGWKSEDLLNTAFAAERVAMMNDKSVAAISSESAALQNGLVVISRDINNAVKNQTRFVAVARKPVVLPDADKLSLIVRLSHQAGSLAKMLAMFSDLGLNLSKIQSLPIPETPWEYSFYVDVETGKTPAAMQALYQLAQEQSMLKFLGWYNAK